MKNLFKFLLVIVAIGLICKLFPSNESQDLSRVSPSPSVNSTSSGIIPQAYATSTTIIPSDMVAYLKSSTVYSPYYNANKKFAVYYTNSKNPDSLPFLNALNPIINDNSYKQYYNFMQIALNTSELRFSNMDELKMHMDFMHLCHAFCIVNPVSNNLFYYDSLDANNAAKLPTLFADLKNW